MSQPAIAGPMNCPPAKNSVAKLKATGMNRGATWSVLAACTIVKEPFTEQPKSRKCAKNAGRVGETSGTAMATVTSDMVSNKVLPRPQRSDNEPQNGAQITDSRPDIENSQPVVVLAMPEAWAKLTMKIAC